MSYFEDIRIGEKRELGRHTFTADEIIAFAERFDPQPFHLSEEAAARSHFKHLCASGWHTAAVCMRLLVDSKKRAADEAHARGEPMGLSGPSPGFRDLKWLKPVYVGDTITFSTETVETRPSASRPGWGLVTARHTGANQDGDLVYSIDVSAFIERRPG